MTATKNRPLRSAGAIRRQIANMKKAQADAENPVAKSFYLGCALALNWTLYDRYSSK